MDATGPAPEEHAAPDEDAACRSAGSRESDAGGPPDFGAAVAEVVRAIPPGRAMTYGGVAAALGSRASRQVGRIMAFEGADLPWWRVVRAGGLAPVRHEARALEHWRTEGTPLVEGTAGWRVDMRRAGWSPD